jgi:DNA-binding transcriptional ArsR family regulator
MRSSRALCANQLSLTDANTVQHGSMVRLQLCRHESAIELSRPRRQAPVGWGTPPRYARNGESRPRKRQLLKSDNVVPASSQRVDTARTALLDSAATDLLLRVHDIVCEATRAQIVRALAVTQLSVTELSRVVGRTKWTTSRHLRVLRTHQLVVRDRRGRQIFYRLSDGPVVEAALAALDTFEDQSRESR